MTLAADFIPLKETKSGAHKQVTLDKRPHIMSAADLGEMVFPDIKWIVPMYLPEGCTILAGMPKLGKSWLALDIALAVARGHHCLGDIQCWQGDVLYLALEDNPRRLKSRIEKVSPPDVKKDGLIPWIWRPNCRAARKGV